MGQKDFLAPNQLYQTTNAHQVPGEPGSASGELDLPSLGKENLW